MAFPQVAVRFDLRFSPIISMDTSHRVVCVTELLQSKLWKYFPLARNDIPISLPFKTS